MELYQHQQKLLDLNPKKHLLAWETGTGKTVAACQLAKKNVNSTLVIMPKSLKEQWLEQDLTSEQCFVTKETFRRDWNKIKKYDCLIIDEAHYFSGIKSQMSKSLLAYVKKHKPEYIYLLTATPYLSSPFNIYCLAAILGVKWSYPSFRRTFFTDVRMGSRVIPVIKKGIEPKIAALVNQLGSTVRLQDCVDLPEQIFETEYFEVSKEQQEVIREIKQTEVNHIVKWTKCHQVYGGTLKGDGYSVTKYFKSEKLQRLRDICSEHKKVVVVCRYNAECEMIRREIGGFIINGETTAKHDKIKFANEQDQGHLIINAACSEGYELPTFDLMVFYSYDFSLKNYIQMIGRISRINNPKKNVYLSLITKGTVDEDVYNCIQSKKSFDLAIYGK